MLSVSESLKKTSTPQTYLHHLSIIGHFCLVIQILRYTVDQHYVSDLLQYSESNTGMSVAWM